MCIQHLPVTSLHSFVSSSFHQPISLRRVISHYHHQCLDSVGGCILPVLRADTPPLKKSPIPESETKQVFLVICHTCGEAQTLWGIIAFNISVPVVWVLMVIEKIFYRDLWNKVKLNRVENSCFSSTDCWQLMLFVPACMAQLVGCLFSRTGILSACWQLLRKMVSFYQLLFYSTKYFWNLETGVTAKESKVVSGATCFFLPGRCCGEVLSEETLSRRLYFLPALVFHRDQWPLSVWRRACAHNSTGRDGWGRPLIIWQTQLTKGWNRVVLIGYGATPRQCCIKSRVKEETAGLCRTPLVVLPYVMRFLDSDLCQISHGHQMPDVFFSLVQTWEKVSWLMFVLSSFLILLQCRCRKGSGSRQLTSQWSSTAAADSPAPGRLSPQQISKVC